MWREYVSGFTDKAVFASPATRATLGIAEEALGIKLPKELCELLQESDGIEGEYRLGLVWPIQRIQEENHWFRANDAFRGLYMPFDCLLFFGDAGNGDQFAYSILDSEVRRNDIFVWNHEDDSRSWVASSLKTYFEWSFTGKLKWRRAKI